MNILFIVFGNNAEHYLQSNFSIGTFLAKKNKERGHFKLSLAGGDISQGSTPWSVSPPATALIMERQVEMHTKDITINIITDKPEMYNAVADDVNIIRVEEDILNKWKGEFDFFWRIKIKAIEHVYKMFEGQHILYLDSDTFLFGDISYLINQLNAGCSFMHLCEGEWGSLKSKTERKMWGQINNNSYGNVTITEKIPMWNAGVIGIPGKTGMEIIAKTLMICDDMLKANVTRRLIEQYAFSVALSATTTLLEAQTQIAHYWSNKEGWNKLINDFFIDHFLKKSSKEEMITAIKNIDFSLLPVYAYQPSTREKLKKFIDSWFPNKREAFIKMST